MPASPGSARGERESGWHEILNADSPSFRTQLRRVLELSFEAFVEKVSREQLASVLRELPTEARAKLSIVMAAGREGLGVRSAHASMSGAPRAALGPSELESAGDELGDHLARGCAIACATQFDLEAPLARWSVSESDDLEERIWLRFGKQLAISSPGEWECLGALGPSGESLTRLYLRHGRAVWWSFGVVLDRPSREMVRKDGWSPSGRHFKLGPLQSVAARRCEPERYALRRALRAIRARVGELPDD